MVLTKVTMGLLSGLVDKITTTTYCDVQVVENNVNVDRDSIHVLIFC